MCLSFLLSIESMAPVDAISIMIETFACFAFGVSCTLSNVLVLHLSRFFMGYTEDETEGKVRLYQFDPTSRFFSSARCLSSKGYMEAGILAGRSKATNRTWESRDWDIADLERSLQQLIVHVNFA